MPQIFISYSRKDEEFARRLALDLDRLGAGLWIDTDNIPPGVNWSSAVQQGLDICEALILVISPESLSSKNVEDEWQYFRDEGKPIVPVLWQPVDKLHFQLRRIHYVDFANQDYAAALEQLRARLFDGVTLPLAASPAPEEGARAAITLDSLRKLASKLELTGHRDSVRSVAISPDGTLVASCGEDKTVRLWNSTNRKRIKALIGHEKPVNAVAFSASGWFLASASEDRTVRLWHVPKRFCVMALRGHTASVTAVAYSPAGPLLASAWEDCTVRLWDAQKRQPVGVLGSHGAPASDVAFSPDGRLLASGGEDQTVRLWEIVRRAEGRELAAIPAPDSIYRLAFSPDGQRIALALNGSGLALLDIASHTIQTITNYADYNANCVRGVAFSPDGKLLIMASLDGMIRVWNVAALQDDGKNRAARALSGHSSGVTGVAFSADGTRLASCSHDSTLRVWGV